MVEMFKDKVLTFRFDLSLKCSGCFEIIDANDVNWELEQNGESDLIRSYVSTDFKKHICKKED